MIMPASIMFKNIIHHSCLSFAKRSSGNLRPLYEAALAPMPIACPTWACSRATTTSRSPSAQDRSPDGARTTGWRSATVANSHQRRVMSVLDRGADPTSRMRNDSAPIVPTPSCGEDKSNDFVELMGIEPTASRVRF